MVRYIGIDIFVVLVRFWWQCYVYIFILICVCVSEDIHML